MSISPQQTQSPTLDEKQPLDALVQSFASAGGDVAVLLDPNTAKLVVHQNRILRVHSVAGVRIEGAETSTGAEARIIVEPGVRLDRPVHLCFGVLPKEGLQEIVSEFEIGEGAYVRFIAHCSFPAAERVKHVMDAKIRLEPGADMEYTETHYHGPWGGVEVLPVAKIYLARGAIYRSVFKLTDGAAGRVHLDYEAFLDEAAVCELEAKVYGKARDHIYVKESIYLNGRGARGLAKTRIVASDECTSEVVGEIVGAAPEARGHVDCIEILKGKRARASAIPRLVVQDERAKLTHEAAIGSVDKKQVETLMARGLDEEQAVEVVVKGLLR